MNEQKSALKTVKPGSLLPLDEFDDFFNDFLSRKWPRLLEWNVPGAFDKGMPKVDIIDHDKEIEIQAALPGVKKEDVDITVSGQSICIKATTKKDEKQEEDRYFRREIMRGEFQRTLGLPENVNSDHAKATFKDGLLTITMPKTETSKRKNIAVS